MSKDYDNTNRGVLFKNDRKESDKHPDYKGSINVDGVEHWLDAWIKTGAKGKFMSLSINPKEPRQDAPKGGGARAAPKHNAPSDGFEDDMSGMPF
jgi:hypothetical protein